MSFFRNFPITRYYFGDETRGALFNDLTVYVDLVDQISQNTHFYEYYNIIDGTRPDVLSYQLYGDERYYWTFYLLNEKIRVQGWPLSIQDIYKYRKQYYPNLVLNISDPMYDEFFVGDICAAADLTAFNDFQVTFVNPPFKAKILEKNYDLGQMTVSPLREIRNITINEAGSGYTSPPTVSFSGGGGVGAAAQAFIDENGTVSEILITDPGDNYTSAPTITISAPNLNRGVQATATATLSSYSIGPSTDLYSVAGEPDPTNWDGTSARALSVQTVAQQWDSVHHYEDANGNWIDLEVNQDGGVNNFGVHLIGKTPVTVTDRLIQQNEELSKIKVFKPEVVGQIDAEYQKLLRQ
jgi:hypothetical protein